MKDSPLPPEFYAREVLHYLNIDTLPTPITEICNAFDIELHYRQDLDAEGILIISKNEYHIIVKDTETSLISRRNFTIAHEIGHFYLPWHHGNYACGVNELNTYNPNRKLEYEANAFASELMLPDKFFDVDVKRLDLSFDNIKQLSEKYQSSLTATALKFIKRTEEQGALICSVNGTIQWCIRSGNTRVRFRQGQLSPSSDAGKFFTQKERFLGQRTPVLPSTWISTPIEDDRTNVFEDTISMPNYNQTLSIINIVDEDY